MALMIPSNPSAVYLRTAGERKLFDLLKRLPDDCIVRFEVLLGMRDQRPDYTIIDPRRGVIFVEVKDWGVSSIAQANPEQFFIRGYMGSSTPKPGLNPDLKCQIYVGEARQQLVAMPALRDERQHLAIPVDYLIAFPNITRQQFIKHKLDSLIKIEHVLFREDLKDRSPAFQTAYESRFPVLSTPITAEQQKSISAALMPEIALPRLTHAGFIPAVEQTIQTEIKPSATWTLSLEQEEIAKSLGEGPRLLRGIAGTGKTLIMLYRAKLHAANDEKARILILCWNTALANYMQQAYDNLQFTARGKVEIIHFTEFARQLMGIRMDPDYGWDDERIVEALNAREISEEDKYDAVYIDEAQDFRKEWIEFIFNRLIKGAPRQRNLIIAADDAQRIYQRREISWASLGIPMIGRSKVLKTIFRNAARVWVFSAFLQEEKASYVRDRSSKLRFSTKGGYDPQLIECKDLDSQVDKAVELIQKILKGGQAARNILVLYRHKMIPGINYPLVDKLLSRLKRRKIPHEWIAQDTEAKRTFNWDAETVKISTIQSAKGMDAPIVIILGAETFRPDFSANEYDETRMMYVALTRAREFLVVLYSGEKGMVQPLKAAWQSYLKYRDAILRLETTAE